MDLLPDDVVAFLLKNPEEIEKLQKLIKAHELADKFHAEFVEKRQNAKWIECGVYGCKNMRNEMDQMCESCNQDYLNDHEAYK